MASILKIAIWSFAEIRFQIRWRTASPLIIENHNMIDKVSGLVVSFPKKNTQALAFVFLIHRLKKPEIANGSIAQSFKRDFVFLAIIPV